MSLETPAVSVAPPPEPHSEHGAVILAVGMGVVGLALLAFLLTGGWRRLQGSDLPAPPAVVVVATPAPAAAGATAAANPAATIVASPFGARPAGATGMTHISAAWEARFYPIYERTAATFGVNWLLLASIHKQETAFSTAPTTYHGLNFAHCCGGPMQFNVTNGPVTTWALVRNAYRYGKRPTTYDHQTATHPSIYDDFDAVMAAGWLLYSDGAGSALDGTAWQAAYDYYGHDSDGVTYADQVLARAIGWSQHGFCINCGLDQSLVDAVDAAYGAPVRGALIAEQAAAARAAAASQRAADRRTAGSHAKG
jgi:hypothetical protein